MTVKPSQYSNPVRGFTLVEILVVIVIVGIMTGLAVLSVSGNPQRDLLNEARRLQMVLGTAADEALMQGREFGLMLNHNSYEMVAFDIQSRKWVTSDIQMFSVYVLSEEISLSADLEGEAISLLTPDSEDKEEKKEPEQVPEILFLSSGEGTAFSISLRHEHLNRPMLLVSDGVETVEIEYSDE